MLWNQCTCEWYNHHGHKNNQDYKILNPKREERHAYFQIEIMKQKNWEQTHDACETKIQWNFIIKKK
jgi:hypothetical protein